MTAVKAYENNRVMLKLFTRIFSTHTRNFGQYEIVVMSDALIIKRPKFVNKYKKRTWEERRTDYQGKNTSEEGNESKISRTESGEKIRKRKYAMLLGYSGANYYGMQRNPFSKTIEEDLFTALHKAKFIDDEAFDHIQSIQFQRAARTDKGVSAIRQVVSIKLPETVTIDKINEHLPEVIRVFGLVRVTKGFNSKSQCSGRTYAYMLPTVAFAPREEEVDQESYRITPEIIQRVNKLLGNYSGTLNFHNFTSKKKPNDPSVRRYITSFICGEPFLKDGVEFVVMKVKGQSFMMHQIRKMIGLIIGIVRGHVSEEIMKQVFTMEKVNIPRAPGLGLVLEFIHYDQYNNRYGNDGLHEKLLWDNVEKEVEEFRDKYIFPNIIDTEINEKAMVTWLSEKLRKHRFDDLNMDDAEEENEEGNEDDSDKEGHQEKQNVEISVEKNV